MQNKFTKYETAYIVVSNINPDMMLTTGEELVSKRYIGPGTRKSVKFFKTRMGALRRASGGKLNR